ncbi:MAG TPA: hypothetical protein VK453_19800 [Micromonosporaceae bacterium]|nr:hypothetical protein [Micromonosporaceae bacterium]
MTPEQTAGAAKRAVNDLGGAAGNDPRTMRRARQIGLTGWAFYVAGRGGALGDVRAEIVAAALGFISPDAVQDGWEAATRVLPPLEIAMESRGQCCRWGRDNLATFADLTRLVDLTERIVLSAEAAGAPLFAAWRAMPMPDDAPAAQAAVLLHLLREHRGAAHLMAVRASGLTPLEAILAGPAGEAGATAFGWQPPYPAFEPLVRKRAWAEALTDRIAGEAYRVLDAGERIELAGLLDAATASVDGLRDGGRGGSRPPVRGG